FSLSLSPAERGTRAAKLMRITEQRSRAEAFMRDSGGGQAKAGAKPAALVSFATGRGGVNLGLSTSRDGDQPPRLVVIRRARQIAVESHLPEARLTQQTLQLRPRIDADRPAKLPDAGRFDQHPAVVEVIPPPADAAFLEQERPMLRALLPVARPEDAAQHLL